MKRLLLIVGLLFVCAPAHAQTPVSLCMPVYNPATGAQSCVQGSLPKLLNGLTNTVISVKGAAGLLGLAYCYNPNAAVAYLQLFDAATAASVTLGTTVPKLSLGIPSALASGIGPTALGVQFLNGIQAAVTTTATGSTAPASAMDCNVSFN